MSIRFTVPRIAILHVGNPNGLQGGAERFTLSLKDSLQRKGVKAQIVEQVSSEFSITSVLESYSRFHHLDLSEYDAVISTKSPAHVVRHPNHVCYLQHTMRQFYDRFHETHPSPTREQRQLRNVILKLDKETLSRPWISDLFVIGKTVQKRLQHFSGIESQVLYQGANLVVSQSEQGKYFFLPGRLHPWKRVDLAIGAMSEVKSDVSLVISGEGEDESRLRKMAGTDERIRFIGRVSDEELKNWYSGARAVIVPAKSEDFGLTTVEASSAGKPIITLTDSGEPRELVSRWTAGVVCKPLPKEVATAMDYIRQNPVPARVWGENAKQLSKHFSWDLTANTLLAALGFS